MSSDTVFSKCLTAESAESAETILIFFLGVLSELCGERFCFFFDQIGRPPEAGKLFRPAATLTPDTRNLKPKPT